MRLLAAVPAGRVMASLELRREHGRAAAVARCLAHVHDRAPPASSGRPRARAAPAAVLAVAGVVVDSPATAWPTPARPRRPRVCAAHDGHVARVVARRLLLLVGVLVFLIHDDQPERFDRREDRRARADHDARAALADPVPLVVALAVGQMAVQHGHRVWRPVANRALNRSTVCGVSEISGTSTIAPSPCDSAYDRLQIHLRLAAARDAVQEERGARGVFVGSTRVSRVKFGVPPNFVVGRRLPLIGRKWQRPASRDGFRGTLVQARRLCHPEASR